MVFGIGKLWKQGKEVKKQADAQKKEKDVKKAIEKEKVKFENKKDKEIAKIKETQAHQLKLTTREFKAYVVVNLVNGTLCEELAVLGAEVGYKNEQPVLRVKDKEENIIFEEPKPDAVDEFNYTDKETVEKEISKCKTAIKEIQSGTKKSKEGLYESDWLETLRYWEARKTHILLGEKGSYMKIRNGVPHYEFDLIGYFKIPVYRYTSKSTISIPPLGKIITGQVLMKKISDEINADGKDAQKLLNTIYGLLILVALIGSIFLLYKSGQVDAVLSERLDNIVKNLAGFIDNENQLNNIENKIDYVAETINQTLNQTPEPPTRELGKVIS